MKKSYNVTYFYRSIHSSFSIKKVTQTITSHINNKEEFFVPYTGVSLKAILGNIVAVYRKRNKMGINHVTGEIHYCVLGLIGCKSVLTIHDTVSLDFHSGSKFKKLILEWFWYRIPLKIATKVICISEATKRSVEKYTKRKDLVVIHNAVDPYIEYSEEDLRSIPTILFIGTNPNKNLERCFNALKGIKCSVTIIGKLTPKQIECLNQNQITYVNKYGLTDQEVRDEYKKCNVVSFCSLFEGFGMPIIEANKAGRAVITSSISVLKEIGGDSVCYVNPEKVEDIRAGYCKLLTDVTFRKELVKKGIEHVKQYDYLRILPQWLNLYESIK